MNIIDNIRYVNLMWSLFLVEHSHMSYKIYLQSRRDTKMIHAMMGWTLCLECRHHSRLNA